jgi:hypothetical protein
MVELLGWEIKEVEEIKNNGGLTFFRDDLAISH